MLIKLRASRLVHLLVSRGVDTVGLLRDVSATFAARCFDIDFIYTSVAEGRATIAALVTGPGEALGEVRSCAG